MLKKPGIVAPAYHPSTWKTKEEVLSKLEASLAYVASTGPAKNTLINFISNKETNKIELLYAMHCNDLMYIRLLCSVF